MSGEFATSEWRVAMLSVGLVSIFVASAVLHAIHSLFHLPSDISHQFLRLKPLPAGPCRARLQPCRCQARLGRP